MRFDRGNVFIYLLYLCAWGGTTLYIKVRQDRMNTRIEKIQSDCVGQLLREQLEEGGAK